MHTEYMVSKLKDKKKYYISMKKEISHFLDMFNCYFS